MCSSYDCNNCMAMFVATASEPAKLELDSVDVVHLTTVLEDCVDQFVVLGRIMPASYDAHPGAENMVADEIRELLQQQKQIENKYEQVGRVGWVRVGSGAYLFGLYIGDCQ